MFETVASGILERALSKALDFDSSFESPVMMTKPIEGGGESSYR